MQVEYKTTASLKDLNESDSQKINNMRIYFGHQSVGYNILEGIQELKNEYPLIGLSIIEEEKPGKIEKPMLLHSKVGKNRDPESKINDFVANIENGIGKSADYVALKLCYVDIKRQTNVEDLFEKYQNAVSKIKKQFPNLKIIHFTAPLKTVQTGSVAWFKRVLGKKPGGYENNIKRNQYNDYIREKYQGVDPIFDIAAIESTKVDGTKQFFSVKNEKYESLVPGYTKDGGHLNVIGRKRLAEKFILFLVSL